MLNSILSFFKEYFLEGGIAISIIGIAISIIGIAIYLIGYIFERRDRLRWQEFKTYHELIKELVSAEDCKADRQTAAIYELRYFKRYYEHSLRMLKHLKENWKILRLLEEIDITIECLEGKIKREKFWSKFKFWSQYYR